MGTIRVKGLGKAYKIYPNKWSRLIEWFLPKSFRRHELRWVLRDVSFEVQAGEAVGIIGINGAGKSTLLKMVTGTTQPSEGSITIQGRVAALLELGMGFHPDFSGRQNVFMAGQLLGMSMELIEQLMPEIEAFAEIGEAINRPVRTYSSGMQMRLAFSVATALRPDVLIVDEALSVGDAYFQHKSFERIRKFREAGTTLLIVSHDRQAIQSICDTAILLEKGKLAMQGRPEYVFDYYTAAVACFEEGLIRLAKLDGGRMQTSSGTGEARIDSVRLLDVNGRVVDSVPVGGVLILEVEAVVVTDIPRLILGFMIKDYVGQTIYGINTHRLGLAEHDLVAGERVRFRYEFKANLGKGHYSIALALSPFDSHLEKNYEWRDHSALFHVINMDKEDFVGCNWLNAQPKVERLPL